MSIASALLLFGGYDTGRSDYRLMQTHEPVKAESRKSVEKIDYNTHSNKWNSNRVASDDFTSPFKTVAELASPFMQLKYLSDDDN